MFPIQKLPCLAALRAFVCCVAMQGLADSAAAFIRNILLGDGQQVSLAGKGLVPHTPRANTEIIVIFVFCVVIVVMMMMMMMIVDNTVFATLVIITILVVITIICCYTSTVTITTFVIIPGIIVITPIIAVKVLGHHDDQLT